MFPRWFAGTIWPWNGSVPEFEPVSGSNESLSTWCPVASGHGHGAEDNALSGVAGQACFVSSRRSARHTHRARADAKALTPPVSARGRPQWFSNGCSIGCPSCEPTNEMCPGPSHAGKNTDFCGNGMKPTLPDEFRSYNLVAKNGTKGDKWMSTPWRAPGTAPVLDACGSKPQPRPAAGGPAPPDRSRPAASRSLASPQLIWSPLWCARARTVAGGTPARSHSGAQISPTPWFKQGDLGAKKLPAFPTGTTWEAGGEAEVSWAINANHGGGYS